MPILKPQLSYQDGHFHGGFEWVLNSDSDTFRLREQHAGEREDVVTMLPGKAVLPGFSNGHSHAFQRAIRGRTHARPEGSSDFWSWRNAMYQVVEKLTPEDLYTISKRTYIEMLEAGFTQVGEFHYVHHQAGGKPHDDINEMANQVIQAAIDAGIRITLFRVDYLETGYRGIEKAEGQKRFMDADCEAALLAIEQLISKWKTHPGVRIGIAPHSVRAVHPKDLERIADWCTSHPEIPLHIHAAEQLGEIEETLQFTGLRPIELLDKTGILSPNTTLIHGTHLSPEEERMVAASGTAICVCPTTEADLGDGLFHLTELMRSQVPLTIGSDSQAVIDPFVEMRCLDMHERLRKKNRSPSTLPGEQPGHSLISIATTLGYDSCGWRQAAEAEFNWADAVSLDLLHPALLGLEAKEVTPGIAFHGDKSMVRDVWVKGTQVVKDGTHSAGPSSREEYVAAIRRIFPE